MAVKRSFNKHSEKNRTCLSCGRKIDALLKDNTMHTCAYCGQQHFVDIYDQTMVLTAAERPELRRRLQSLPAQEQQEIAKLRQQLSAALAEAQEWKEAAEGLARMVEELKQKEQQQNLNK